MKTKKNRGRRRVGAPERDGVVDLGRDLMIIDARRNVDHLAIGCREGNATSYGGRVARAGQTHRACTDVKR
jgi:hypothetical protein